MNSLIAPSDNLILFAVVTGAAAFGIYSEHKKWFGKLSGILVTMISMSILSVTGLIPAASDPDVDVPVYNLVFDFFIPLAIPLLLFSSDITKIIKESGRLLLAYIIGAAGVILGSLIAFWLIDLGADSNKTAGVIAATLIGGSVNFIATAEILNFSTNPLFTATIAVDNLVSNLFTLFLILVPSLSFLSRFYYKRKNTETTDVKYKPEENSKNIPPNIERIALSVFTAALIVAVSSFIAPYIQNRINTDLNLTVLLITFFSVVAVNIFPRYFKNLADTSFIIGLWLMYVFLAVIGAATNLSQIFNIGPSVLLFYTLILIFHFIFMTILAKLFKLDVYEVVIASAANVMGPSVAAPMAASMGQKRLIMPGILTGILGYIIGTFIGVSLALMIV
ncbi:MAG: DUF819 family protein [Chlorobi bacterium]|nr:DUF819 family protein [Chlorobiota bacterium]